MVCFSSVDKLKQEFIVTGSMLLAIVSQANKVSLTSPTLGKAHKTIFQCVTSYGHYPQTPHSLSIMSTDQEGPKFRPTLAMHTKTYHR